MNQFVRLTFLETQLCPLTDLSTKEIKPNIKNITSHEYEHKEAPNRPVQCFPAMGVSRGIFRVQAPSEMNPFL